MISQSMIDEVKAVSDRMEENKQLLNLVMSFNRSLFSAMKYNHQDTIRFGEYELTRFINKLWEEGYEIVRKNK